MFTVSKDLVMPTTVTGSWPRPDWFTLNLAGRSLSSVLVDSTPREQFGDALAAVTSDQTRAGLDILTNGDYHCDNDFFGRSWANYPIERLPGLAGDEAPSKDRWDLEHEHPPGTLLHEILSDWLAPRVVGRVSGGQLEYARIWRLAQSRTDKPVRFGTISAQALAGLVNMGTDVYDDRQSLLWDMSGAMNIALLELADAGCRVIQVEEPNFHFFPYPADRGQIDFLIEAFNHEVAGLEDVEVWVHTCFGNPNMQRVFRETAYHPEALAIYLERLNCDVITLEMKDRSYADLELLGAYKGSLDRKIAVGVVSHRTLQVERPDEVAADIRHILQYIDPENLILTSDCGFGRQGCTRSIALYKAAAIAQGANIVRRELGLPETEVPIADPALQPQILTQ